MNNIPSRSQIFRSYMLEKKRKEAKACKLIFSKLLFTLSEKQYSKQDIKELCKRNGYSYIVESGLYYIYESNV